MKKRILIAENDLALRKLIEFVMNKDFDVICVENGAEALTLLETTEDFDLLIADIDLESLNGFELTGKVRQHPYLKNLPVILITEARENTAHLDCFQVGADEILVKQFNPIEMMLKVHRLLLSKQTEVIGKFQP